MMMVSTMKVVEKNPTLANLGAHFFHGEKKLIHFNIG
jgi:hypothetical protein